MRRISIILVSLLLGACASMQEQSSEMDEVFTIDELKQQAEVASFAGAYTNALLKYQKILAKDPDDMSALLGAGEALLAVEQPERAEKYFARVLDISPKNIPAREGRALAWLLQGDYQSAKNSFLNLVDDEAGTWRVFNALGVIADISGEYDRAIAYYQRAIVDEPNRGILFNNMGYSQLMAHDYQGAERTLSRALALTADNERVVNNLSLTQAMQQKYEIAIETSKRAMSEAVAYNNVGYVAYLNSDYDVAEEYFRKAMQLSPKYYKRAADNLELVINKKKSEQSTITN